MLWENQVIDKYEKIKKLRKIIFKKLRKLFSGNYFLKF